MSSVSVGRPKTLPLPVFPDEREPWHRIPKEPQSAFELFTLYKSMGIDRSLARVEADTGASKRTVARLSSRWAWPIRAAEWDRATAAREDAATAAKLRVLSGAHLDAAAEIIERSRRVSPGLLQEGLADRDSIDPAEKLRLALAHDKNVLAAAESVLGRRNTVAHTGADGRGPVQLEALDSRLAEFTARLEPALHALGLTEGQWALLRELMVGPDRPAEIAS